MPDLNIRKVDKSLLTAVNVEAAKGSLTQRDYVIGILEMAVGWKNDGAILRTRPQPGTGGDAAGRKPDSGREDGHVHVGLTSHADGLVPGAKCYCGSGVVLLPGSDAHGTPRQKEQEVEF